MKTFTVDNLKVAAYNETSSMGEAAANFVHQKLQEALQEKDAANMILATGSSQFSFLEALQKKDIDWQKITVFHLDEYIGISEEHPASFRKYLKERILNAVAPKKVYYLEGDANDLDKVMEDYAAELRAHPIDIACIGIGENGHIAFNDPPIADFNDPKLVKIADLDDACRNQQLGEGWFPTFDDVPKQALSLTIPAIMSCKTISCVVPDERKSDAVRNTLYNEVSTSCPATILRTHSDTTLFLDQNSASKI
ncbi:glucosamine-6-phosphate deaminase [Aurantibacter crassamenti]|uniref:glucosamine-6-phosphate deaminase n=1 Tax=Aurantibacter crassamenti TaxID=1837375 RepID=UPI001939E8A8|nr:glucosamine-6-phosphate deaminase [Aurantibacter crassamenti]MBM1105481.1 glucosamine-6-phosphate deaminase [Aurantibacter crassamenti]